MEELCRELAREQISALCDEVMAAADEDAKRSALEAALSKMYEARGEVRWGNDTLHFYGFSMRWM